MELAETTLLFGVAAVGVAVLTLLGLGAALALATASQWGPRWMRRLRNLL